jgi:WD40 repeat protein
VGRNWQQQASTPIDWADDTMQALALVWSADSSHFATLVSNGRVDIWDGRTAAHVKCLCLPQEVGYAEPIVRGYEESPRALLAWSPGGEKLAVSGKGTVAVYEVQSTRLLGVISTVALKPEPSAAYRAACAAMGAERLDAVSTAAAIAYSADGAYILAQSMNPSNAYQQWRNSKLWVFSGV